MREDWSHKLEVHVASICFEKWKLIIVQRSSNRKIFPGKWACGGGQIFPWESFEEAVVRQAKEELWANIIVLWVLWTYEIPTPQLEQKKIPGLKLICEVTGYLYENIPRISAEHSEQKKITRNEIKNYDFIPGMMEELEEAFEMYDNILEIWNQESI